MRNWAIGSALLLALTGGAAVAQEEHLARSLQSCEKSYQRAARMVCSAPGQADNPAPYQDCLNKIRENRTRCISQAHMRNDAWQRRTQTFRRAPGHRGRGY
jgi:hypothetical protein